MLSSELVEKALTNLRGEDVVLTHVGETESSQVTAQFTPLPYTNSCEYNTSLISYSSSFIADLCGSVYETIPGDLIFNST